MPVNAPGLNLCSASEFTKNIFILSWCEKKLINVFFCPDGGVNRENRQKTALLYVNTVR